MRIYLSIFIFIFLFFFITKKEHFFAKYKDIEMSPILSKQDIEDLKKGQIIMTKMFRDFDKICRKHNIKYWCGAGTLLGVIRHKGWIPFDGDIDIGMTLTEYEKFKKVVNKEISNDYIFQHLPSGKPCSKIRHLYSHYKSTENTPHYDDDDGLQIDIFLYKEHPKKDNTLVRTAGIIWEWNKNDIYPLEEKYFEDIKVYVPKNSDIYLKKQYGVNYNKLPNVNKRYPHEGRINPNNVSNKMREKYKEIY
jgi:phosphorylcholine metabolism protein LicD